MIDNYIVETSNSVNINLPEGRFVLPIDFQRDFGDKSVNIVGVKGKTVITSYDGTPSTLFKPQLLNTTVLDNNPDGLYVVSKHSYLSYGGGLAHLNLKGTYNTDNKDVFYVQGTILKKENGIWSRHYTGAGFITRGNLIVKDIIFDSCQFYLFSPFDINGKIYTTSDLFEVDGCVFDNVSRVISSIAYGGINHTPNWYNSLNYYSSTGQFRFRTFKITNNTFSDIHSFIVGGFPPSEITQISGNVIKNCKTILHHFNLFIKNYSNSTYFEDRIVQNISNNVFINSHPESNNWTTSIIRTSGLATITGNHFIDVSQQIVYLSGGASIISNNIIRKWNDGQELLSPVFLVKMGNGTHIISDNEIVAPMSTIVAVEGYSNVILKGNNIIGLTRYRSIIASTPELSKDRVYYITDLARFKELAVNYDPAITLNNHVYYNKSNQAWSKTIINNIGFLFSKSDEAGKNQYLKVTDNVIEVEGLTNISSRNSSSFKSIKINDNDISSSIYMHLGLTIVDDYIFNDNYLKSQLTHTGLQIRNLYNENNKIAK